MKGGANMKIINDSIEIFRKGKKYAGYLVGLPKNIVTSKNINFNGCDIDGCDGDNPDCGCDNTDTSI